MWRTCARVSGAPRSAVGRLALEGWENLLARECEVGVRPADTIFLAPDYRVDAGLSAYARSREFRSSYGRDAPER